MHTSKFFKLFPPPKFMVMPHAGLDISDDTIRCIEYKRTSRGLHIAKFAATAVPHTVMDGGDVKDEKALSALLTKFDRDNDLSYVKVSVPEEKAYLFQTDVPEGDMHSISQNIEFKIEENVPLAAADAVFYFDILPVAVTGGALRASVSVVSRAHIEHLIGLLRGSGISPIAFEVIPKSVARSIIPPNDSGTVMIIHVMRQKTGIYIVSGGVVCFSSTLSSASSASSASQSNVGDPAAETALLVKEISRVYTYWMSHNTAAFALKRAVCVGGGALAYEGSLKNTLAEMGLSVSVADVWNNVFSLDRYIPPISRDESLDYAVAAGLAIDA